MSGKFKKERLDWSSFFFTGLSLLAVLFILLMLFLIVGNIVVNGWSQFSWGFLTRGSEGEMFDLAKAGVWPMIFGTTARVLLMTIFVIPVGVITALYLTEYGKASSPTIKVIRAAVNNLAGVPSIVFGLFGLGFFIQFIGQNMDGVLGRTEALWGKPSLIWASMTLAVMTLPVVIVTTEESLRSIPPGLREASLALGATKLETVLFIVLPQALPGILTGGILAISRAAGEVAPILFTGAAYYIHGLPRALTDEFMDLGYHIFILTTQSPNIEKTRPILYATVMVLLMLTFLLNIVAILIRAQVRKKLRSLG